MTTDETAKLIAVLKVAWPDHPVPNAAAFVEAYHVALADLTYEAAMEAAAAHIKASRFFPRPSELRGDRVRRLDPADYRGDAYLDVPWMRHGKLPQPAAPAIE